MHLEAVADDPRIFQQRVDLPLSVPGHLLHVEPVERLDVAISSFQYRDPAQPRLRPLQHQKLEQPPVVMDRHPPLRVVVFHIERVVPAPRTAGFLFFGHGELVLFWGGGESSLGKSRITNQIMPPPVHP